VLRDGNGVELAQELRRHYGCRTAIVSGHPEPTAGRPAGIDMWLLKPVGLPQLRAAIEALLSG